MTVWPLFSGKNTRCEPVLIIAAVVVVIACLLVYMRVWWNKRTQRHLEEAAAMKKELARRNKVWRIAPRDLTLGPQLGQGATSSVWRGKFMEMYDVAIKGLLTRAGGTAASQHAFDDVEVWRAMLTIPTPPRCCLPPNGPRASPLPQGCHAHPASSLGVPQRSERT